MTDEPDDADLDIETHELGELDAVRLLTLTPETNKLILKGTDAGAVIDLSEDGIEELQRSLQRADTPY